MGKKTKLSCYPYARLELHFEERKHIFSRKTITLLERVRIAWYKRGIKLEDDGGELEEIQADDASYDLQMGRFETCLK